MFSCMSFRTCKRCHVFVECCTSVHCRYSEDSLCVVTQDSMTIREIGEILCHGNMQNNNCFFIFAAGILVVRECCQALELFYELSSSCSFLNIYCKSMCSGIFNMLRFVCIFLLFIIACLLSVDFCISLSVFLLCILSLYSE